PGLDAGRGVVALDRAGLLVAPRRDEHVEVADPIVALAIEREDLGNVRDLAGAVLHTAAADDHVRRGGDLRANRAQREVDAGEHAQALESRERLDRGVRVYRAQASRVPRVHRLEQVEALAAADLAD